MNLRPSILETDALPAKLHPYAIYLSGRCTPDSVHSAICLAVSDNHKGCPYMAAPTTPRSVTSLCIAAATGSNAPLARGT